MSEERLSVPPTYPATPPPTSEEVRCVLKIADVLISPDADLPSPSRMPAMPHYLEVALRARPDVSDRVLEHARRLGALDADALAGELRRTEAEDTKVFELLTTVIAGAYLMIPEVRASIGYPGQERSFPAFDQVAEEVYSGILDPVLDRTGTTLS